MAIFSINNIHLKGIACCVPKNKIKSTAYKFHTAKENNQFIATTGIETRRIVSDGTTASDLCLKAGNELLTKVEAKRSEINVLIFLSQTPDYKIPCTATILQEKLGLGNHCLAFDVNLGCSGYVYGLSVIASLLQNIKGQALLLVGDTSSTCVNQQDKSAAPLFSDAGSATLFEYKENAKPIYFNLQSDGNGFDAIITKKGGSRYPISENDFPQLVENGRTESDMFLDGIKVFNFSRKQVVPNIEALLHNYTIEKSTIDFYLFHQANLLMNESIRKKLKIEKEKVPYSLKEFGNTSSASIPITITHCIKDAIVDKTTKLILSGFGVGLSWGSAYLELDKPTILPIIEY